MTRWYHRLTQCIQRACLLGEGALDRKRGIENRLEELAQIFPISIAGVAVLDNICTIGPGGVALALSGDSPVLVDYTSPHFRAGKASISREVAALFDCLGSNVETWQAPLMKLRERRLHGRFLAWSRERLRGVAGRLGVRYRANSAVVRTLSRSYANRQTLAPGP
jgi:hypothetical protein